MVINSDSSSDGWGNQDDIFSPKKQEVKLNIVTESEKNDPLRSIKVDLHSILVSQQTAINGQDVLYKFYDMFGFELDPNNYNCDGIDELLQAMPDKIQAFEQDGIYTYRARHDDRIADIQSLVRRQQTKEQVLAKKNRRLNWSNNKVVSRTTPNIYSLQYMQQISGKQQNVPLQADNGTFLSSYQDLIMPVSTSASYPMQYPAVCQQVFDLPSRPTQGNTWGIPCMMDTTAPLSAGTKLINMLKSKPTAPIVSPFVPRNDNTSMTVGNISLPDDDRRNHSSLTPLNITISSFSETSVRKNDEARTSTSTFGNINAPRAPTVVKAIVKRLFDDEPMSKSADVQQGQSSNVAYGQPKAKYIDIQLESKVVDKQYEWKTSAVKPIANSIDAQSSKIPEVHSEPKAGETELKSKYVEGQPKRKNVVGQQKSQLHNSIGGSVITDFETNSRHDLVFYKPQAKIAKEVPKVPQIPKSILKVPSVKTEMTNPVKKEVKPVQREMACSSILQLMALEATRFVEEKDGRVALIHLLAQMILLFRTYLPPKPEEEQEFEYLVENLLCAL